MRLQIKSEKLGEAEVHMEVNLIQSEVYLEFPLPSPWVRLRFLQNKESLELMASR